MKRNPIVTAVIALCSLLIGTSSILSQGTNAFTYQGHLNDGANPANGSYDFRFLVANDPSGGPSQIGPTITNPAVLVSNGLFTTILNFGPEPFNGDPLWLEVGVRSNGVLADFVTLLPRQQLTPSPYAITASNATTAATVSGPVPAAQLTGRIDDSLLSANVALLNRDANFQGPFVVSGNFDGNGSGLTNLNASSLAFGSVPDARLSSNVPLLVGSQTFSGANTFSSPGNSFSGNGAGLTVLNASGLGSGTVPDTRLSSNVAQLSTPTNSFSGTVVASDVKVGTGAQHVVSSLYTNALRIVYGAINPHGTNNYGIGFNVSINSDGSYTIIYSPPFSDPPIPIFGEPAPNKLPYSAWVVTARNYTTNSIIMESWYNGALDGNCAIPFIVVGGR